MYIKCIFNIIQCLKCGLSRSSESNQSNLQVVLQVLINMLTIHGRIMQGADIEDANKNLFQKVILPEKEG